MLICLDFFLLCTWFKNDESFIFITKAEYLRAIESLKTCRPHFHLSSNGRICAYTGLHTHTHTYTHTQVHTFSHRYIYIWHRLAERGQARSGYSRRQLLDRVCHRPPLSPPLPPLPALDPPSLLSDRRPRHGISIYLSRDQAPGLIDLH